MKQGARWMDGETVRSPTGPRSPEIGPPVRDVVRNFHPDARPWVVAESSRDATGRLLDLARVCPGAHLLAFEWTRRGPPFDRIARELLVGVVNGLRLDRLILEAAEEVFALFRPEPTGPCARLGASPPTRATPPGGRPWSPPDHVRLRLLVRRASARVDPRDFWGMPPPAFSPEDIPPGRKGALWYATMRTLTDFAISGGYEVPPCAWSFFSRRAGALAEIVTDIAVRGDGTSVTRAAAIGEGQTLALAAFDCFAEIGAWPHRDSDVWRTADRMFAWWDARMSTVLPPFVDALPDVEGVVLAPVATGSELRGAATRLRNCLAGYHAVLDGGRRWVFTGTLLGADVAVDVRLSCGRYVVSQVAGRRNASVSAEQRSALRRWLARLNRPSPSRPTLPDASDGVQLRFAL